MHTIATLWHILGPTVTTLSDFAIRLLARFWGL